MNKDILIITPLGKKTWQLYEDFSLYSKTVDAVIKVEKGFISDLASVPKYLWAIFPPFGEYTEAAVIHDGLYRYKIYDRKTSDEIFYELMLDYKVNKVRAWIMFKAVRWFGWIGRKWEKKDQ